jgi:hypothetical protein
VKRISLGAGEHAIARCLCEAVAIEIDSPAFWAWHDHGQHSRRAHGAAYATYVGCRRKRMRVLKGKTRITRYEDGGETRSFCSRCGTPLLFEKKRSPHFVNIPRALFEGRTGREPRYHLNIAEQVDWAYFGASLSPLKGYPGVMWQRPKRPKRMTEIADFGVTDAPRARTKK